MDVKTQCHRSRSIAALVTFASLCGGCGSGGSLVNTAWTVAEIQGKTDADQETLLNVKSILVEFRGDGRLFTSVKHADGAVDREEQETYRIDGDTIVITHPNYERRVNATLNGDTLTVSSDRFNARLARYIPPEAGQPAMFRPSSVGRAQYRSVAGVSPGAARR